MNKVILVGNLTRDPEVRYTPSGKAVCSFSIATNEGKSSEGKDLVEFHNIVAWEKTGELVGQYCTKGSKVAIEGKLQTRSWEKDGVKRYSTEVVANRAEFLTPKSQSGGRAPEPAPEPERELVGAGVSTVNPDDIPF